MIFTTGYMMLMLIDYLYTEVGAGLCVVVGTSRPKRRFLTMAEQRRGANAGGEGSCSEAKELFQ